MIPKGHTEHISNCYFSKLRNSAQKRGIDFTITIEDLEQLWQDQKGRCALSGVELIASAGMTDRLSRSNMSVDRKCAELGYDKGNVQLVDKDVNFMKQSHTNPAYIDWCRKVVAWQDHLEKEVYITYERGDPLALEFLLNCEWRIRREKDNYWTEEYDEYLILQLLHDGRWKPVGYPGYDEYENASCTPVDMWCGDEDSDDSELEHYKTEFRQRWMAYLLDQQWGLRVARNGIFVIDHRSSSCS